MTNWFKTILIGALVIAAWEGYKFTKNHEWSVPVGKTAVVHYASEAKTVVDNYWSKQSTRMKWVHGASGAVLCVAQILTFIGVWGVAREELRKGGPSGMFAMMNDDRKREGLALSHLLFYAWATPSFVTLAAVRGTIGTAKSVFTARIVKPKTGSA